MLLTETEANGSTLTISFFPPKSSSSLTLSIFSRNEKISKYMAACLIS